MYYKTKETVNEYIKISEGYNGSSIIEKLVEYLPCGSVLEIGSGSGNDIPILQQYYKITASDFSPLFVELIISKYPDIKTLQLDVRNYNIDLIFDGIYSNKVLQHLTKVELEMFLLSQRDILNKSGIICHTFWAGQGEDNFGNIIHKYYTINELEQIISQYYTILKLEYYKEMEDKDSILVIAKVK